jgi:periplasmic protein TonB
MRDPLSRLFSFSRSSPDSWLHRVGDNIYQVLAPVRAFPSSANGAPLHLLTGPRIRVADRSRTISFLMHALLVAGIVYLGAHPPIAEPTGTRVEIPLHHPLTFVPPTGLADFGHASLGIKSGGGENDSRPARHGLLAPPPSMPILPPRQAVKDNPELPVLSSVFAANAPQVPLAITNLGLPWMKENPNTAGPGKDHGFGSGQEGGMGDEAGPGAGQGDTYNGPYGNRISLPACAYCPDPQYTDAAREAKLQGKVTLRVLVGADGRASQIQVIQGIGMGLDERAGQSVQTWRFVPAHDGAHRAVPMWVTIEVVFRLI